MSKKKLTIFEDKKPHQVDEDAILTHLQEAQRIDQQMSVGQRDASLTVNPDYPELPIFIWVVNDSHLGSTKVDYTSFTNHYQVTRTTPNFYCVCNGDEIDNFMIDMGRASTGVYENPITPEQQALLMRGLFKRLDKDGKLLGSSFGNHNQWIKKAGLKFENTWLRDFDSPVLNCGGLLTLKFGTQAYRIAMTHLYWGNSKKNPTNAAKNYIDYEYPTADIVLLGHTHQKEYLWFLRDQQHDYRIALIGGCYKTEDEFAAQAGYGGKGKLGGFTLALYPDARRIDVYASPEAAREQFYLLMHYTHSKQGKKPISRKP